MQLTQSAHILLITSYDLISFIDMATRCPTALDDKRKFTKERKFIVYASKVLMSL
jgi:hypothetical protein